MVEALLDTKRQPLTRVNVRFVPRPKRLTKLTPTPDGDWPPSGVTPAPKPAISLSESATLVKARKSMYARLTTVAGSKVSNPARRMRDPVTMIVARSPEAFGSSGFLGGLRRSGCFLGEGGRNLDRFARFCVPCVGSAWRWAAHGGTYVARVAHKTSA